MEDKMKKYFYNITAAILFLSLSVQAQVDIQQVIQSESGNPINIKSENLVIRNNENLAIFSDNVRVTQGKMNLKADEVKLHTTYNESEKKNKINKLEAEGNISFKAQDKSLRSNKALYDVDAGILLLEGNVRMEDTGTSLAGKIFRYDVKTGRSEIRNSGITTGAGEITEPTKTTTEPEQGGRVRAVFTPGEGVESIRTPADALSGFKNNHDKDDEKHGKIPAIQSVPSY